MNLLALVFILFTLLVIFLRIRETLKEKQTKEEEEKKSTTGTAATAETTEKKSFLKRLWDSDIMVILIIPAIIVGWELLLFAWRGLSGLF